MKKQLFLLFLIVKTIAAFACKCEPLEPISEESCKNYDVIFYGSVDSVGKSSDEHMQVAYFTINELYKGNAEQQVKINFDATSSCMMSFAAGEQWIIYANYQKFDFLSVNICLHSRKFFDDPSKDYFLTTAQRTFEQEKTFLKTTLHIQPFAKVNEINRQTEQYRPINIQPEPKSKLWLLFISFLVMAIILFLTRKKQ